MLCSFFPLTHSHTAAHTLHQPLPSTLSLVSFSSLPHTHAHTRPPLSGWGGGELQGWKKKKKLPRSHRKRQQPHVCVRLHDVYGSLAPLIRGVVLKWPFFHGRTQGRKQDNAPPDRHVLFWVRFYWFGRFRRAESPGSLTHLDQIQNESEKVAGERKKRRRVRGRQQERGKRNPVPFWVIFKSVKIWTLTNRCHPELRLETTETSCELCHMDELQHVSKRPLTCEHKSSLSLCFS